MPINLKTLRCLLIYACLATTLAGCSQNAGEACQVDGDCATGLKCDARAAGNERGMCFDPKAVKSDSDTMVKDNGTQPKLPDAGAGDAGPLDEDAG
jgi:hypothetical protein